jgi:hypothetical protein
MKAPTPENYSFWYADRVARTQQAIAKSNKITGRQIRQENLSVKVLVDAGYVHNHITDTMEKING